MKAESYMAYYALQHFVRHGRTMALPGAPPVRTGGGGRQPDKPNRDRGRGIEVEICPSNGPARDGGKCVTARKGWGQFEMTITGRASHAGLRPQDGRSVVRELARQILDLESVTDYDTGITVVVGTVQGGIDAIAGTLPSSKYRTPVHVRLASRLCSYLCRQSSNCTRTCWFESGLRHQT